MEIVNEKIKVEKELTKNYLVQFKSDTQGILISKEMVGSLRDSDIKSNQPSDFLWGNDGEDYMVLSKDTLRCISKFK